MMKRFKTGGLVALVLLLAPVLPAVAVEVERVTSPGGIEAWLVQDHSNPIISLELAFRGGAALDPVDKQGLANLVASTIDEGSGDLDSQAFQGELDDLSVRLSFSAGRDSFGGSLRTLTETRDRAFELLKLALTDPRFDEEPVERIRSQLLARLSRESQDPNTIVGRTLRQLFFPDHAYGRPTRGTEKTLAAVTVEDLRAFVASRFGRDQLYLSVVGDVTPEELAILLDKTFLDLPAKAAAIEVPDVEPQGDGDLVVIEKAIPQSIVAFGHSGIKRADPDFYAAYVVNYVLGGGGFSSRLYREVREKRGLAYSVYSYLGPMDHSALVVGGVATQNPRVAESLDLIRAEWRRMAQEGPTAEELAHAKTYLTGSYPLRLSSTANIASMLVGIQMEDLGIDYIDRRNGFIEAVTLEDAARVAQKLYQADALTVVVVGQPAGVEPTRAAPGEKS